MSVVKNSLSYNNPLIEKFTADFFRKLPLVPGVYMMKNDGGLPLYIGKAKELKKRLTTYSQYKPGTAPEHILEMIENVDSIQWHECTSEEDAIRLESELLHAIRPPFNIAGTDSQHYLYLGIRPSIVPGKLDFQLSSKKMIRQAGYTLYGCFKNRRETKAGYVALLRLIYAVVSESSRFSFPAKICRVSPPWLYSCQFPKGWELPLSRFLEGKDFSLLSLVTGALLEKENIPQFMYPSIQDDIEIVKRFYHSGPKFTREMRRKAGIKARILSHRQMDELIEADFKKTLASRFEQAG